MWQSAEDRTTEDAAACHGACSCLLVGDWDLELQRLMRPSFIVVANELAQHVPQVTLVERDDVVQTLST